MTLSNLIAKRSTTPAGDWEAEWDLEVEAIKILLSKGPVSRGKARGAIEAALKKAKPMGVYSGISADIDNELLNLPAVSVLTDDDVERACDIIKNSRPTARATSTAPDLVNLRELLLDNITDNKQFALQQDGALAQGHKNWNNRGSINPLFKITIKRLLNAAKSEYQGTTDEATEEAVAQQYRDFFEVENPNFKSVMDTDGYNDWLNSMVGFLRQHKVDQKLRAGSGWDQDIVDAVPDIEIKMLDRYELRLLKVFGNDPNQKVSAVVSGQDILQSAVGLTLKAFQQPSVALNDPAKIARVGITPAPTPPRQQGTRESTDDKINIAAHAVVQEQMDRDRQELEEVFGNPLEISPINGTNPLKVIISKAGKELLEYQVHLEGTQWGEVRFVTGKDAHELFADFDTKAKILGFIATQTVKTSKRVGDERRLFMEVYGTKAADITIIAFALMHSHVIPILNEEQIKVFNQQVQVLRAKSTKASGLTDDESRLLKMAEKIADYKSSVGGDPVWKAGNPTMASRIPDSATIQTIEDHLTKTLIDGYWDHYTNNVEHNDAVSHEAKLGFWHLANDAAKRQTDILSRAATAGLKDVDMYYKPAQHNPNATGKVTYTRGGGTKFVF